MVLPLLIVARAFFVATDGDDANPGTADRPFRTFQRGADALGAGDALTVHPGVYAERVRLTRSGSYFGREVTIQAEGAVLDGSRLAGRGPLFDTAGQDHLVVRGLTVRHAPDQGIGVVGSYRVRVEGCRTDDTATSGIFVDKSHDVTVSRCDVAKGCAKGGEESVSIKRSTDVTFEDSEVHDTFHEGIDVKEGAKHVVVRRNRVHHVERQGLYADAWDADTGDIRFENNLVWECMVGIVACTESGGLLHDVAFVGNVVYDCRGPGMMLAKWGSERMTHRIRRIAYLNNTVVACGGRAGQTGKWAGGMLMENDQAEDVTVANNLLSGNPYAQLRVTLGLAPKSVTLRNNLIDGPGENLTKGNLVARPRFVDAAAKDFRLAPGSPGIDAGAALAGVGETDAGGKPRVRVRIDVGAYESGS